MLTLIRGLLLLLLCGTGAAHAADSGWLTAPQNDHARIRLQAERGEGRLYGLLTIELQSGWKTYWRSPGAGGVAPEIRWSRDETARWYWPVPSRFEVAGIATQGYHRRVTIPMIITGSDSDVLEGTLTLSTCSNVCLLTDYPLRLNLNAPVDPDFQAAFEQAMRATPAEGGISADLSAHLAGDTLRISGTSEAGWRDPQIYFDPLEGGVLPGQPRLQTDGNRLTVTVPVTDEWGDIPTTLAGKSLSFVLTNGGQAQQTVVTLGPDTAASEEATTGIASMLLAALLGGLILNLMPCVLPVMGMKLSAVLHIGQETREIRRRFLATSAGIIVSFALLATMVTALKLSGAALGWGIQFHSPWFIGLMVVVTLVFALNLFGVFNLLLPASFSGRMATAGGRGMLGSFLEGVFATLLATPCSAPFLGTAVAFALAAPLGSLWLIFIALGLGMAAPWLLVAAIPQTARLLPRPGRWMAGLKILLGLMMLATSLWLATLLAASLGYPLQAAPKASTAQAIRWQPLSEAAITQARAEGKRVFVDITADWCITCKVNTLRVLHQPDVIAALNEDDVVALRGDWSKPSPIIAAFLQQRGRYAIPFNEVSGPGLTEGQILPPLLDKQTLLSALTTARQPTPRREP